MTQTQYDANVEVIRQQMEQSLERSTTAHGRASAVETAKAMMEVLKNLYEKREG